MQDLEFTVERGKLYMLQTRSGKRSAEAAVKIALDFVHDGLITKEEAICRVEPRQLEALFFSRIDPTRSTRSPARASTPRPAPRPGRSCSTPTPPPNGASAAKK